MNVYDFDKTIYKGDSTIDFYLYCVKQQPWLLQAMPKQVCGFILYTLKQISKTQLKEYFFSFLKYCKDVEDLVYLFWDQQEQKVVSWYRNNKQIDDVIISASPEFLLKEICHRLDIQYLIASNVDIKCGRFYSENCYGMEKRLRFLKQFPHSPVDKFFSDSVSDTPMAELAKEAYLVKASKIMRWNL